MGIAMPGPESNDKQESNLERGQDGSIDADIGSANLTADNNVVADKVEVSKEVVEVDGVLAGDEVVVDEVVAKHKSEPADEVASVMADVSSEKTAQDSWPAASDISNGDSPELAVAAGETAAVAIVSEAKGNKDASALNLTQQHVSHLLADVLQDGVEDPEVIKNLRFPMVLDCLLGFGLLIAVGGFTIGLVQMYLVHEASQNISEQKYKKAIDILRAVPMPQVFARPGSDTEELLSKARYLDAIDKLESNSEVDFALKELGEIHAGSRYFNLAQEAINENTEASPMLLQGGTETTAEPGKQSLLDKTLNE